MLLSLFLQLSFSHGLYESPEEIRQEISSLQEQSQFFEERIRSYSDAEFIRMLHQDQLCDAKCEKATLGFRDSILLFTIVFRGRIGDIVNATGEGLKKVYAEIVAESIVLSNYLDGRTPKNFYRDRIYNAMMNGEGFLKDSLGYMVKASQQQGQHFVSYVGAESAKYDPITAAGTLAFAVSLWPPWTIVTEGIESLFLGPFHVFCHASQILFFTILKKVSSFIDYGVRFTTYRPEISLSQKVAIFSRDLMLRRMLIRKKPLMTTAQASRRFRHLSESDRSVWLDRFLKFVKDYYANLSEISLHESLIGRRNIRENFSRQRQYAKHIRELSHGIALLRAEVVRQGTWSVSDTTYAESLIQRARHHMNTSLSDHQILLCKGLFR